MIISCAGTAPREDEDISYAETFISKNFSKEKHDRLIVLPIQQQGIKGEDKYNLSLTDKYSLEFMKLGFTVIDRSQLNLILEEKTLDMAGFVEKGNYKELKRLINADIVLVGLSEAEWVPPSSYMLGNNEIKNKGYINALSASIRIIDTETSEVLITSRTAQGRTSKSTQIIMSIKSKLAEKGLLD